MKILCVIDSLGSGGAQRQLVELAKGLKLRGNEVSFLVYHHEPFYLDELKKHQISYTCVSEANYLKRILKIRRFIRKGNYNSVLSFLEGANFITELAGIPNRKWKLIVGERSSNPKILSSFKLRFYRWFHVFADYIVANSHENIGMIKRINRFAPSRKYKVIYNIVGQDIIDPMISYTPRKDEKLHILVAASHQHLKNGKGLVQAISLLNKEQRAGIQIDWYGDESPDSSFRELKLMIKDLDLEAVFKFHKATDEIYKKMQAADVIGLFSLYEGLPNVVCEAMQLGKPVIASAVSDIPLLLEKEYVFDPKDSVDICRVITEVMLKTDEQLRMNGTKNREKGNVLFNREKNLEHYINLMS